HHARPLPYALIRGPRKVVRHEVQQRTLASKTNARFEAVDPPASIDVRQRGNGADTRVVVHNAHRRLEPGEYLTRARVVTVDQTSPYRVAPSAGGDDIVHVLFGEPAAGGIDRRRRSLCPQQVSESIESLCRE